MKDLQREKYQKTRSTTKSLHSLLEVPSNEDLENSLLSAIINETSLFFAYEHLLHEDLFHIDQNKSVYASMKRAGESLSKGQVITFPMLVRQIVEDHKADAPKVNKRLSELKKMAFFSFHELPQIISVLSSLDKCRKAIQPFSIGLQSASGGDIERLEFATTQAAEVMANNSTSSANLDWYSGFDNWLEESKPNQITGVTTGFQTLNTVTGGWQNSDFVIIAARPGMGKTIALTNFAANAAKQNIPCLFITAEIDAKGVIARVLSQKEKIPYGQIIKRDLVVSQIERLKESAKEVKKWPLHVYDYRNSMDVNDVCKYIRMATRKYGIKAVFIDYLQKLGDKQVGYGQDTSRVGAISGKLKDLQGSLDIPFIMGAQLSREVEKRDEKIPQLSDLRNSGDIEQDASIVIGLRRTDYYERNLAIIEQRDAMYKNEIDLIFLKDRNGGGEHILMKCYAQYNTMQDDNQYPTHSF